jgi:putative transposase
VAAAGTKRVSLAGMLCFRLGAEQTPRLIQRSMVCRGRKNEKKGFGEHAYIRLVDAAHQQLRGPLVLAWDNINTHKSKKMRELIARHAWQTVFSLPPYAPEFNPVEGVRSAMKSGLVNLARRSIEGLTALVKRRLRRMQYRSAIQAGLLAKIGLDLKPRDATSAHQVL